MTDPADVEALAKILDEYNAFAPHVNGHLGKDGKHFGPFQFEAKLRESAKALRALRDERDKARKDLQWMVEKAAEKEPTLDGYRELGQKCAHLEAERDTAQRALKSTREELQVVRASREQWIELLRAVIRMIDDSDYSGLYDRPQVVDARKALKGES